MSNKTRQAYVWSQFFAAIAGWQFHPGTKERMPLDACARLADAMTDEYLERYGHILEGDQ